MRDAGYEVKIHDDHFGQETADDVWLGHVTPEADTRDVRGPRGGW